MRFAGERLQMLREAKDLSRDDLAKEFEVQIGTIRNWEINYTCPKLEDINKLAQFFGVKYPFFIVEDTQPSDKQ